MGMRSRTSNAFLEIRTVTVLILKKNTSVKAELYIFRLTVSLNM